MVKDDRHRTRAIRAENEEIAIRASQSVFRLVTNIQDETHRYAISFLRKKHQKAGFASTLTAVPGIGEQRAAKLLKHFKSMAAIRTADVETLAKAPGMSRPAARGAVSAFTWGRNGRKLTFSTDGIDSGREKIYH